MFCYPRGSVLRWFQRRRDAYLERDAGAHRDRPALVCPGIGRWRGHGSAEDFLPGPGRRGHHRSGLGRNPATRADGFLGENGPRFGQLVQMDASGGLHPVADISEDEARNNPDSIVPPDSNPFGLLALPGGQLVTDAGGNDLLYVGANRRLSRTLAVFPNRLFPVSGQPECAGSRARPYPPPSQSDRTKRSMSGNSMAGRFRSAARMFIAWCPGRYRRCLRQASRTSSTLPGARTEISRCARIAAHSLRAADRIGALIRVSPDGATKTTLTENLEAPTALAIGPYWSLYITTCGDCAGAGQIVRIEP